MRNKFYRVCFVADNEAGSMLVVAETVEFAISLCAREVKKKAHEIVIDTVAPLFISQEEENDFLKIVFQNQ